MSSKRYTEEFKVEAVKQVPGRGIRITWLDGRRKPLPSRQFLSVISTEEVVAMEAAAVLTGTFIAWRHANDRDGIKIDDSRKR